MEDNSNLFIKCIDYRKGRRKVRSRVHRLEIAVEVRGPLWGRYSQVCLEIDRVTGLHKREENARTQR